MSKDDIQVVKKIYFGDVSEGEAGCIFSDFGSTNKVWSLAKLDDGTISDVCAEKITIEEPSEEQATEILRSKQQAYEEFHHLPVEDDVPAEIVRLSKRYLSDRHLPSSALDLLDRAMSSVKIANEMAKLAQDGGSQ